MARCSLPRTRKAASSTPRDLRRRSAGAMALGRRRLARARRTSGQSDGQRVARPGHQRQLRPGMRPCDQPEQPGVGHPVVRRRSQGRGRVRCGHGAWPPGRGRRGDRQALPRPWRHRRRHAPRTGGRRFATLRVRGARTGAVSSRHRGWRPAGDGRPLRAAAHHRRTVVAGEPVPGGHDRPAARRAALRWTGDDRRAGHGGPRPGRAGADRGRDRGDQVRARTCCSARPTPR